jgi:signal recognition particle subunit SRP54
MTKAGARQPRHHEASRKKRIAGVPAPMRQDINKLLKMHRQMADMMKAMGGKGKGGGMMRAAMGGLAQKMGLPGGMGGMGGMPDLSKMDPKQLEALQKQAEAAGLGKAPGMGGMPGGLPGGMPGGLPGLGGPKLPGLGGGGLPGLPKKK